MLIRSRGSCRHASSLPSIDCPSIHESPQVLSHQYAPRSILCPHSSVLPSFHLERGSLPGASHALVSGCSPSWYVFSFNYQEHLNLQIISNEFAFSDRSIGCPKLPIVLLPYAALIFVTTATCMFEYSFWEIPLQHKIDLTTLYGPYLALCKFLNRHPPVARHLLTSASRIYVRRHVDPPEQHRQQHNYSFSQDEFQEVAVSWYVWMVRKYIAAFPRADIRL